MSENERLELRGLKLDWSPGRTEQALVRVQTRVARRQRLFRATLAVVGVVALSAGALVAWERGASENPRESRHLAAFEPLKLRDGSEVSRTAPDTELRVAEESSRLVRIELERGTVRCRVTPNADRAFVVTAGAVSVTVVGTEFTVERRGSNALVAVQRGRVRVAWGDGEERRAFVSAGESGLYPPSEPVAAVSAPVTSAPAGDRPEEPARDTRSGQASEIYRARLEKRDYSGAFAMLSRNPALAGDTVEELLAAADVARLSNHPSQAVPYLQRVLREHARDERAPLAAFTLGRTLSALGRTREAMDTFARVRSAWPASPLGEDALVRQAEALHQLGDRAGAARLAEQYDRAYPKGRRRAEVRRYAGLE